jgi:cytochrome c5
MVTFASAAVAFAAGQAQLPEGDGKRILEYACTGCHNLDRVTNPNAKRDKDTWQAIVESMRDNRKADVSEAETPILVDYLVKNFGDQPAAAAAGGSSTPAAGAPSDAEMAKLVETACGSCHGLDLVSGYKGNKEAWDGVVQNMVASGAQLTAAQIPQVVDYLAKTYPAN